ncbi:Uncharacterised protein [Mycobacteroides abscessus subsp. abscessus]|nr:Uncharacterised protein [Mycobacteroides abscessus subsp. abscessus]
MGEANDPVGVQQCEVNLMQAGYQGDAVLLAHPPQQGHDSPGGAGVEAGDRLVGQNQAGLLSKGARDTDALLLAAAEMVCSLQRLVEQPHLVEGFQRDVQVASTGW